MKQPPLDQPEISSLESDWDLVDKTRSQLAEAILSVAESVAGIRHRQLIAIANWLSGPGGYRQALQRPDVICFCLHWGAACRANVDDGKGPVLSDSAAAAVVRHGFCEFSIQAPTPRDLTPFVYPVAAIVFGAILFGLASFFILPSFREMFDEFGIELPRMTEFLLSLGHVLRIWMWPSVILILIASVIAWLVTYRDQRRRTYSLSWIDRLLTTTQPGVAAWTGHVASLIDAGVVDEKAVQVASACSDIKALRLTTMNPATRRFGGWLGQPQYAWIDDALQTKQRPAKIALLREISVYYRSISYTVIDWWLKWLAQFIIWMIFTAIFFFAAALLMPMISIVSGLTGGF